MTHAELANGLHRSIFVGIRQSDGTVDLGPAGAGANIADWPATITLDDATERTLASVAEASGIPRPADVDPNCIEFATYE